MSENVEILDSSRCTKLIVSYLLISSIGFKNPSWSSSINSLLVSATSSCICLFTSFCHFSILHRLLNRSKLNLLQHKRLLWCKSDKCILLGEVSGVFSFFFFFCKNKSLTYSHTDRNYPQGCSCVAESSDGSSCRFFECSCNCDLTAGRCDYGCCCDPDCTSGQVLPPTSLLLTPLTPYVP